MTGAPIEATQKTIIEGSEISLVNDTAENQTANPLVWPKLASVAVGQEVCVCVREREREGERLTDTRTETDKERQTAPLQAS